MRRAALWTLLAAGCGDGPPAAPAPGHDHANAAAPADPEAVSHYTCPMHPSVRSPEPGRCPICGMDLTPVTHGEALSGQVVLDEGERARWGIRTAPAVQKALTRTIRLAGPVGWDLRRQRDVVVKATGTVQGLRVAVGTAVRAGDALFSLRSPELVAAQGDFLASVDATRASARNRLVTLGLTDRQIEAIAAAGQALQAVPVLAPSAGVVTELSIVDGSPVEPWTAPARIADAERVWVDASSADADAAALPAGAEASVTLADLPGRVFHGTVYPVAATTSAVQLLRVEVDNADGSLRPGQIAVAEVRVELASAVVVPVDAVIYAGSRQVVFVDVGGGKLELRRVVVGAVVGDEAAVVSGLAEGEVVVRDGNFLVAADSRMHAPGAWADPP